MAGFVLSHLVDGVIKMTNNVHTQLSAAKVLDYFKEKWYNKAGCEDKFLATECFTYIAICKTYGKEPS